jgi:hypothetical protein
MRIIVFFLLLSFSSFAQDYAIGNWKTHFPVNECIDIAQSDTEVFAASSSGLIILNKHSIEKTILTKAEGLMDIGITSISYYEPLDQLFISYNSGGVDIYSQGNITSFSDIIRSSILGSKRINKIKEYNELIYFCTDFGVVVFNPAKEEVVETYYIGSNGDLLVNDITFYGGNIVAATNNGVYFAPETANLANKINWTYRPLASEGNFTSVFGFNNKLFANYNGGAFDSDTLYQYANSTWAEAETLKGTRNISFEVNNEKLLVAFDFGIGVYDTTLTRIEHIYEYSVGGSPQPGKVIVDKDNSDILWVADRKQGLVKNYKIWNNTMYNFKTPISTNVNRIKVSENKVWMASGGVSGSQWQNVWIQDGISCYDGFDWSGIDKTNTVGLDTIYDFIDVAIDPEDNNHVFVATLGSGILEFNDRLLVNHFTDDNSTLEPVEANNWRWLGITSVNYDIDGNLWAANHSADNLLSVYDINGVWHGIDVNNYTSNGITGDLITTSNNQIWLIFPKSQGLLIYNANQTFDDISDDNGIVLNKNYGLPSNTIFSAAEDRLGDVWIGTDKGIAVVYSPSSIFSGGTLEAKKILIEQDGYTEYLLENNTISAIAVDGANRKWIGTRSSGVFLVSSDGTEELARYTKENSSLPSNEIKTIAINQTTGEVFFGTEDGIVSYRGDAILGESQHNNVSVYPNPVRETYAGPIAIKGLVDNANVKIADVSGATVFETTALGGQAIWYGTDFNGERVATGIYIVFSVNTEGDQSFATKILFIN